jgi:spermidine synthase
MFGEWGFVVASREPFRMPDELPAGLRFLTLPVLRSLFEFPLDMRAVPVEVNQLNNQVVVRYHEEDWRRFRE